MSAVQEAVAVDSQQQGNGHAFQDALIRPDAHASTGKISNGCSTVCTLLCRASLVKWGYDA
ncbi:hypothetical protein JCM9957A_04400 [Kineosporia succinea]